MLFFKFWKKKNQAPKTVSLTEYTELKHCFSFFSVSGPKNNKLDIIINEDDSHENELEALHYFEDSKKIYPIINLINYRAGKKTMFNKVAGYCNIIDLKVKTQKPVDMNIFMETIQNVSVKDSNSGILLPYFSVIFKLLKDEVLGTGYKDLTAACFREMMKEKGWKTEGRSSFSKYTPNGVYPNWTYKNKFKRDSQKKLSEAKDFAERFISQYKALIKASESNEKNKTAEETAE